METKELAKLSAKIVAKAWADENYKMRLMNDTKKVLEEEGIIIPEGINVHVVEKEQPSTPTDFYFTLPEAGDNATLEQVEAKIAANAGMFQSMCNPQEAAAAAAAAQTQVTKSAGILSSF